MVDKLDFSYSARYKILCESLKVCTEDYTLEASLLCSHFLNADRGYLVTHNPTLTPQQWEKLQNAAKKRATGYPLQYILGEWEFFAGKFAIGEGVLIPRADTETLIEAVLEFAKAKQNKAIGEPLKVLDLCSGSGCIAITLERELLNAEVFAVEKSEAAYEYLQRNISKNNVKITAILGDALSDITELGAFDIIVSNPPYLTKNDMENLQRELEFEPKMALYGREDGLYFYENLTRIWKNHLKPKGLLAYEIGINQASQVENILIQNGFKTICKKQDIGGIMRVIGAVKDN